MSGSGSTWSNSGDLIIGNYKNGYLEINSGGFVAASTLMNIGAGIETDSKGTVLVTGTDSHLETGSGDITVGNGLSANAVASLTIAMDGDVRVRTAGDGTVLVNNYSFLNIGGANGDPAVASGTLRAASVMLKDEGRLNFNHTGTISGDAHVFGVEIKGTGFIDHIGPGRTIITSNSGSFSGITTVDTGNFTVNGTLVTCPH